MASLNRKTAHRSIRLVLSAVAVCPSFAFGQGPDETFAFFENEAQVISTAHQPYAEHLAPATVYVVTANDIKAAGAQTFRDVLRNVPGVDVIQSRGAQAEISIRGMNRALNNRTLVLLDGKSVLNALFDHIEWENIPVSLNEIDRIEVVEGAASALYGANAVSGIINIITKTPEQIRGGQISYARGEHETTFANFLQGNKNGRVGYRTNVAWRAANQYRHPGERSSEVGKGDALISYDLTAADRLRLSAGGANHDTEITTGSTGTAFDDGKTVFARADYEGRKTKAKASWNRYHGTLEKFPQLRSPDLDCDTMNGSVERTFSMRNNTLITGGEYKNNRSDSTVLGQSKVKQDLWAAFFEDDYKFSDKLALQGTGRFDKHPLISWQFSPRGSIVYSPVERHTFRLSAGTSFRYPTLLENYSTLQTTLPLTGVPFFSSVQSTVLGNTALRPEKMQTVEAAHSARLGPVRTKTVGFYYKLKDLITTSPTRTVSQTPPTLGTQTTFTNNGEVRAAGGEFEITSSLNQWLSPFANYSYQNVTQSDGDNSYHEGSPHHKANAGVRLFRMGWTGSLWANYAGETRWLNDNQSADFRRVPSYLLFNVHLSYEFKGRLRGLEIGVTGINMLNKKHAEILAATDTKPGQNGEIIGSRWMGTVSYRFYR